MGQIAVYPGSFDPVTSGHLDILERGLNIFDEVIVAIVSNPPKKPLFTVQERIKMLQEVTSSLSNVQIEKFDGLLIDYLNRRKAKIIIRGLRAV